VRRSESSNSGKPVPASREDGCRGAIAPGCRHWPSPPDGQTLASSDRADALVTLWDLTGKTRPRSWKAELPQWSQFGLPVLRFTPDGKTLGLVGHGTLYLWDVASGKRLCQIGDHPPGVRLLPRQQNGGHAALLVRPFLGRVQRPDGPRPGPSRDRASAGVFLRRPDHHQCGEGGNHRLGRRHRQGTPHPEARQFPPHLLSGNGRVVAESNETRTDVFDTVTLKKVCALPTRPSATKASCLSHDGKTLAAMGFERVSLWDLASGCERLRLPTTVESGGHLGFSHDGKLLAVAETHPGRPGVAQILLGFLVGDRDRQVAPDLPGRFVLTSDGVFLRMAPASSS